MTTGENTAVAGEGEMREAIMFSGRLVNETEFCGFVNFLTATLSSRFIGTGEAQP